MKKFKIIFIALLIVPAMVFSQEKVKDTTKVKEKLERPAFESSYIIDNPTNVVLRKNALEAQMEHRFGKITSNGNDFWGIWGDSNIRLGVAYGITDRFTLGFGGTKNDRLIDLNWKVAILRQTRSNKMPISMTYFGIGAYNTTTQDKTNPRVNYNQDRFSYFHQLIIARRFSPGFSLQIAPSVSHYNTVESNMTNDVFAIAFGCRIKVTPNTAILLDYSQPFANFEKPGAVEGDDPITFPKAGFSLGVEFGTSAHAFQLFFTNYSGIIPQKNYMYNQNDFFSGDIMLGFNITRIYNF
jgi:hypothetical protein